MEKTNQKYVAEVSIYPTFKMVNKGGYVFKFKTNIQTGSYSELDVTVHLDNQKTLSSFKPKQIDVTSYQLLIESGHISKGDRFTIYDMDGKIGKGKIVEVLLQN
jgi:hypothetical protein